MNELLHLALAKGNNFGWGVCSHYIEKELILLNIPIKLINDTTPDIVEGTVIHALSDIALNSLHKNRGSCNIGYTFFENELIEQSRQNASRYDLILAGSTWCHQKLIAYNITNSGTLIQGIDPERFHPCGQQKDNNLFVVFSGGKFELRKGQDLVISAFRILQKKYEDIILMTMWYNFWPESIAMMQHSRHIMFSPYGNDWNEFMHHIYRINGLDPKRIITLGAIDNDQLPAIYAKTDLGIFPNRCEGGTNLVLMEYMACGKPTIASYTSGHKDVLSAKNSLLLDKLSPYPVYDGNKALWADWEEPSVDQLVEQIEYAYHNREIIAQLGAQAGQDMLRFTWSETAKSLVHSIESIV